MNKRIVFSVIMTIIVFIIVIWSVFFVRPIPIKYEFEVAKWSAEYNVPEELVYAIINTESKFDTDVVSSAGTVGLMQILPTTADDIADRLDIIKYDLFDPNDNIRFGTYYISYLYGIFGDWRNAVAAYNGGIGNVSKWLKNKEYSSDGKYLDVIPFEETKQYVKTVFDFMERYKTKLSKRK